MRFGLLFPLFLLLKDFSVAILSYMTILGLLEMIFLHPNALCSLQQLIVITIRVFISYCSSLLIGSSHEEIKCLRQRFCLKYSFIPRTDHLSGQ